MMDWTDRHCRAFHRAFSAHAVLYSEMVTALAVLHGDRDRLLGFDPVEHPVALQLGGAEPGQLAQAARIGAEFGYDEINLNVGCPSDRVQSGRFGACLMREPRLVADCVAAMQAAASAPVTVKCRLGVDDQDPEESLFGLVEACAQVGVQTFVVHARKAWLKGLSPRVNRDVPPLDYGLVRRLKAAHPDLAIHLNGGLENLEVAKRESVGLDGVMLGRAAYHRPDLLGAVDATFFGAAVAVTAEAALERYRPYMAAQLAAGTPLAAMTRHMLGLFQGRRGARAFRRILTVEAVKLGAGLEVLDRAVAEVESASLAAPLCNHAAEAVA